MSRGSAARGGLPPLPGIPHPDTCPLCQVIHGQADPEWACPDHGHELGLHLTGEDVLFMYVCPVQACRRYKLTDRPRPRVLPEDVPQVPGLLAEDIPPNVRYLGR